MNEILINYYMAVFISHSILARGRYISSLELDVSRGEGQCLWTAKSLLVHMLPLKSMNNGLPQAVVYFTV